jgi:hypothetical protein
MTKLRQVLNSWYSVTSQKTWILNCKACSAGGHFRQHSVSDGHCDATPPTRPWRWRHDFLPKQYYTFIIKDDDNFAFPVYTSLFRDKLGNICTYFVQSITLFNYVLRNKVKILNVCLYTCHKGMRVKWSEVKVWLHFFLTSSLSGVIQLNTRVLSLRVYQVEKKFYYQ